MRSAPFFLALCALAASLACTRSHACRNGTLFLTIHLEGAARGTARLEVDVSVDDGAPKAEGSFMPNADDTAPTLEVSFPSYAQIHKLRVDVRAYAAGGTDPVAVASQTTIPLPAGCLALAVTLSGNDGGAMDSGGNPNLDGSADDAADSSTDAGAEVLPPGMVVYGTIGTLGERPPAVGGMHIRDDGLEFGDRTCSGATCVKGGILP
jgi:hypothetical protein